MPGGEQLQERADVQQVVLSRHEFQEKAKEIHRQLGLDYQKVRGGIALLCSPLEIKGPEDLYSACETQEKLKILILDGVTDIHNAAAIIRTASFYGVHKILIGGRDSFKMTPSFFKIASGGPEHLDIIQAGSLPKVVRNIQKRSVMVWALSEHADEDSIDPPSSKIGLVLGAEDRGVSHALLRECEGALALRPLGKSPSLNVSVAAAIAMERLFS
ncbi:MAG: hypothetical protein OXB88_08370 [Bacteriovoracales bacterium]|nr:hypothetical protein [Bacteriovoracales bacterium]